MPLFDSPVFDPPVFEGDSLSRPGGDVSVTLRIEYTTLFIPGAVDLGTFCDVPVTCDCDPPPFPQQFPEDGDLDPDIVPFWFYQYIVDTYTYPGTLFSGSIQAMVLSAQCVIAAGDPLLAPDPSDPETWTSLYCLNGTYAGWESILRRWRQYTYQAALAPFLDLVPDLLTVNKALVQFPPGTRILDQRCEDVTVGDECPACY